MKRYGYKLRLDGTYSEEEIDKYTKEDIRKAILDGQDPELGLQCLYTDDQLRRFKKSALVKISVDVGEARKEKKERETAKVEADRQAIIKAECGCELTQRKLEMLAIGIRSRMDELETALEDIVKRIRSRTAVNLGWELDSSTVPSVFETEKKWSRLLSLFCYVDAQTKKRMLTMEEIGEELKRWYDEAIRDLVNGTEFEHRSTSQIANVKGEAQFRASQYFAKAMRSVVEFWNKSLEEVKELDHGVGGVWLFDTYWW